MKNLNDYEQNAEMVKIVIFTKDFEQEFVISKEMIFQAKYPTQFLEKPLEEIWNKQYAYGR